MPKPSSPLNHACSTIIVHRTTIRCSNPIVSSTTSPSRSPATTSPAVGKHGHRSIARSCRYTQSHSRHFSPFTPKPLARIDQRRDIDSVFFTRSSSSSASSAELPPQSDKSRRRRCPENSNSIDGSSLLKYDAPGGDHKPPDERVVKLGKTLRRLSPLLPNILINPLPTDLLSPQITLHLFPSTHPHLPNVKGRVLYRAALWTVPVAWSSLPLLGNVKLQILSERMVRADSVLGCDHYPDPNCGEERLVVRWKTSQNATNTTHSPSSSSTSTSRSSTGSSDPTPTPDADAEGTKSPATTGINKSLSTLLGGDAPILLPGKEGRFEGLFVFAFDEKGRIASHTIEHADRADGWDRTAKFVTLTDWLLGKAKARGSLGEGAVAGPALAAQGCHDIRRRDQSR